ncbi:hypothetical protein B0J14DRAFT_361431 [Halenospora varia]|nr:hypothetical protein B0J14DRAFT_361431 [Halenospora varia]
MENPTEGLPKNADDVVERKRQRFPKVRTGCKTCKTRRVKCDEGKPGCLRCEKSGWNCDGYPQKPSQTRPILPRLDPNFLPIFFQPRININGDEHEIRYFRYFAENMAHEIAGFFDWELWTRLFPQACQSEDSLRHVIIAMAASRIADKDPLNPQNSTGNTHWHRQSALRHYSKAIKAMKENSIKGNQDPRSIMLNCIILLCFETMHYHQTSGIQQAVIITKMIDANFVHNG